MSVHTGPNNYENGLVFYYDMGNTQKSWKGKPTANTCTGIEGINGLSLNYISTDSDGWAKYGISGTWNSGTYPYSLVITSSTNFLGAIPYSARIEIYNNCPQKWGSWGGLNYVNDPAMTSAGTYSAESVKQYQIWKRENFIYSSGYAGAGGTGQFGYLVTMPVANGTTFNNTTDFVYLRNAQIEQNAFSTPFVNGTRSNTQAVVDLSSNRNATVSSLTYNSNGSLSFSGSDSFSIPSIDFSSEQTIEIWLQPTENDGTRRNPYNQAYGGYGTWTHEPSGVFNYYYGDAGANNTPYIGHTSSFTVNQNEIACVCTTRNVSESVWYKNGIRDNSYTHGYGTLTADSNPIIIGSGYAGGYVGNIFAVKIYNRALSAAEVKANFNSLRGRFGI